MQTLTKTILCICLCLTSLFIQAQGNDTTFTQAFKVLKTADFSLNINHTELEIINSNNDSIYISTHISIANNNSASPFNGITVSNYQKSNYSTINSVINFSDDFINNNEFNATCIIALPKEINIKIISSFGIVFLKAKANKVTADMKYTNFNSDSLSQNDTHQINAKYSTLKITDCGKELFFKGTNSNLAIENVDNITTDTQFSIITIKNCSAIKSTSYSDKYLINNSDSAHINSKKSLWQIDALNKFIQSEMYDCDLTISKINPTFTAINIANEQTTTSMRFAVDCQFSINTSMKHCYLKSKELMLQEIKSPERIQQYGHYGDMEKSQSNVSILSNYGDVEIQF